MPSEFIQRQVDRLLSEAAEAIGRSDWELVRDRAHNILRLDPENFDALSLLEAAGRDPTDGASPTTRGPASSPSSPEAPLPPSSEPASFAAGRYTVKRFLGEGGKKRVYLAHDTTLDRDVAFALIKTEGLDDTARERIAREAQAMGKLGTHPHIVTVFDLGDEAGQPYMVTELMGGGDVEGLIEKAPDHRPPLDRALEIGIQTCRGLEFAHSHGIVHRDLKPGNVWLTEDGTAKLGDFGLAVALDKSRLTQAGMMVGTVSYMPPEQAMGGEVTPRSDLYSLGAMLYEMVTGRPPFIGDESVTIITQHLNTPPVAPSWHRPDCPSALEALILRLLNKDPDSRPKDAIQVRETLESVRSGLGSGRATQWSPEDVAGPIASPENPLYRRVFVGREQELRQLQQAFDAATSGQGGLVMVVGEPGIGKTALCEQLATYAAIRGGKALVGHSYEEGSLSLPYLAFVEAIRSYVLVRDPEALRSDLGSGAADVARIVSEVRDRITGVELRAAGDSEDDRWRLLQAVSGFLRNAAAVQPLVIVLEDLHWADRGTLDLLQHIARNLQGARLLLIGTYRDVEVDRAHPLSGTLAELRRQGNFLRVPLRGLTVDEVHRMYQAIRGQDVSWAQAEAVHRQTEGNPLFIQEVIRYLVEEGYVVREEGRWVLAHGTVPGSGLPEGLRDVVGKRLSRLSEGCNRLLSVAAVIGRDFDLATLRAVVALPEDDLLAGIEEAVRVGVLEERALPGALHYRFAHAFFRTALYEETIAARRLRLHQDVARALEMQYAEGRSEHAAELAEHYGHSTDRADLAKAVEYSELAAQRAMNVYAYGEAERHLEQALKVQEVLDPNDKTKRCDLLLALGEALLPAGEPLRLPDDVAAKALALAEDLGDRQRASHACQLALDGMRRYGIMATLRRPDYQHWVSDADRLASPGSLDRVRANLFLGRRLGAESRERAWDLELQALALAQSLGDAEAICRAASYLLEGPWPAARLPDQLAIAEEMSRRQVEAASAGALGLLRQWSGHVFLSSGDRPRAEAVWKQASDLSERTRDSYLTLGPLMSQAILALLDGELEIALDLCERVDARGVELGNVGFGRQAASQVALRPLLYLGRAQEALERLPEAWVGPRAPEVANANRDALVGLCFAHSGAWSELVQAMAEFGEQGRYSADPPRMGNRMQACLLEAAVLAKDRSVIALARAPLEGLGSYCSDWNVTLYARHLGAGAALLGEVERAYEYYTQALERAAQMHFRPEIALTRLGLAELQLENYPAERSEAIVHLDFAIAEFREMKMQPSLERALRHKEVLKA
jgi:eukaryotic-like serine/threonine-protein kinase